MEILHMCFGIFFRWLYWSQHEKRYEINPPLEWCNCIFSLICVRSFSYLCNIGINFFLQNSILWNPLNPFLCTVHGQTAMTLAYDEQMCPGGRRGVATPFFCVNCKNEPRGVQISISGSINLGQCSMYN